MDRVREDVSALRHHTTFTATPQIVHKTAVNDPLVLFGVPPGGTMKIRIRSTVPSSPPTKYEGPNQLSASLSHALATYESLMDWDHCSGSGVHLAMDISSAKRGQLKAKELKKLELSINRRVALYYQGLMVARELGVDSYWPTSLATPEDHTFFSSSKQIYTFAMPQKSVTP